MKPNLQFVSDLAEKVAKEKGVVARRFDTDLCVSIDGLRDAYLVQFGANTRINWEAKNTLYLDNEMFYIPSNTDQLEALLRNEMEDFIDALAKK